MKFSSLSALLLTAFALSACGSGGGGGGGGGPTIRLIEPPLGLGVVPRSVSYIQLNGSNYARLTTGAVRFARNGNINSFDIMDPVTHAWRSIDIIPAGMSSGGFITLRDNNGIFRYVDGGQFLTHTRFGYVRDTDGSGYLMAQGEKAVNMPHTGSITYNGRVVHTENSGRMEEGTVRLFAHFDRNVIGGHVTVPSRGEFYLGATSIQGNEFHSGLYDGVGFAGAFYGPNAEEVGGTYYKRNLHNTADEFNGAFGAKR